MAYVDFISSFITLLIGAALGGFTVFYSMKDKIQRYKLLNASRRVGMLEQVAQHVGKVSHVFSKYVSLVSEIGPKVERMSTKQERELINLSQDLVAVYEEISVAESKLLLLGEKRLGRAMKLYTAKMAQFRKQVYPGRYSNVDELVQMKRDVAQMRDQFYDILSERYDQKLTNIAKPKNTSSTSIKDFKIPFNNSVKAN